MESIQTIIKTLVKNPTQIKSKSYATQIHAQIIKSFPVLTSDLLSIYSKLNLLPESLILFNSLPSPPIFAWKSIITCYSSNGNFLESLKCFIKMRSLGMYPDHNVFPSVIKSCTNLLNFKFGESVHACVIQVGLEFDVFTGNALLSMYSKLLRFSALQVFDEIPERITVDQNCKKSISFNPTSNQNRTIMQNVTKVFETMPQRDIVSYNTLVLGYAQNNMYNEAIMMIREMINTKLKPDAFTLSNILPIVAQHMDVFKGKEIHGYVIRHGFDKNEFITSGLTELYANCTMVEYSYRLFYSLPKKDTVSWCSIISACVQNGYFDEGLILFRKMLNNNIKPAPISCSAIIPACAHLTTLKLGQQLHGYIIRNHFDDNMFIASSLVNMYAKCGNIKLAKLIFDNMKDHDMVSWTAMIMCYASHGHGHEAISLFEQMEVEKFKPNSVAFVAILTACSHAGMVNEGLTFFNKMVKHYGQTPEFEHYACMVDLLGRAGKLDDAFGLICSMPENRNVNLWLPLLGACGVHKNVELAEKVVRRLCEFDSENVGAYVLLSNTYCSVGRYKDAINLRNILNKKKRTKEPACSWIGIGDKVHGFIAGDESRPFCDGIIDAMNILLGHMEMEGYVEDG